MVWGISLEELDEKYIYENDFLKFIWQPTINNTTELILNWLELTIPMNNELAGECTSYLKSLFACSWKIFWSRIPL